MKARIDGVLLQSKRTGKATLHCWKCVDKVRGQYRRVEYAMMNIEDGARPACDGCGKLLELFPSK